MNTIVSEEKQMARAAAKAEDTVAVSTVYCLNIRSACVETLTLYTLLISNTLTPSTGSGTTSLISVSVYSTSHSPPTHIPPPAHHPPSTLPVIAYPPFEHHPPTSHHLQLSFMTPNIGRYGLTICLQLPPWTHPCTHALLLAANHNPSSLQSRVGNSVALANGPPSTPSHACSQWLVVALIMLNFIVSAMEKQYNQTGQHNAFFEPTELFFTVVFAIELLANLYGHW